MSCSYCESSRISYQEYICGYEEFLYIHQQFLIQYLSTFLYLYAYFAFLLFRSTFEIELHLSETKKKKQPSRAHPRSYNVRKTNSSLIAGERERERDESSPTEKKKTIMQGDSSSSEICVKPARCTDRSIRRQAGKHCKS